jgi:virulence factor Mce-like protein
MKKLVPLLTGLALVLAGCGGANGPITVTASFGDVADLAPGAPVLLADIQVGKVTGIDLKDNRALITMDIQRQARVPRDVTARARRTSLLGERIIDLEIAEGLPANAPPLQDGQHIAQTVVRPDLEDLVVEGTQVLSPISASEIATLVDEGARGFGSRGPELRSLLRSFQKIVGAFSQETDTIESIINSANQLNTTIASEADAHGLAVQNTERALRVLREESDRLENAIRALNRLAVGGGSLMRAHFDDMDRFFPQMRSILGAVRSQLSSLVRFLYWNILHNRNTQMVEYREFNQVLQEFIFCGFNENKEPARNCTDPEPASGPSDKG